MTVLQQALLDVIRAFEARGDSPQTQDVARHFPPRRQGGIPRLFEGLAEAGHIARRNGRWETKAPAQQLLLSDDQRLR